MVTQRQHCVAIQTLERAVYNSHPLRALEMHCGELLESLQGTRVVSRARRTVSAI